MELIKTSILGNGSEVEREQSELLLTMSQGMTCTKYLKSKEYCSANSTEIFNLWSHCGTVILVMSVEIGYLEPGLFYFH